MMKKAGKNLFLVFIVALAITGSLTWYVVAAAKPKQQTVELNVSAAASMTDALQAVNKLYMQSNSGVTIIANYNASGTLQKQIEQGAPADVFISADAETMDTLVKDGLIIDSSRQNLLNNKIVLVVPDNSSLNISDFKSLLSDSVKHIAIGDPEFVPAGTYGKLALEELGIYDQLKPKLIMAGNVRQALGYVEGGDVEAGIVYSTDAAITDKVKIAAEGPGEVNSQIVYPAAIVKSSQKIDAARAYMDFLFSAPARAVFLKYGFSMADNGTAVQ